VNLNADSGFEDQKMKKKKMQQKSFWSFLDKKLQKEHPALQQMKFINFFLFLWVIFGIVDPDPIRIRIQNTGCSWNCYPPWASSHSTRPSLIENRGKLIQPVAGT
jgi:hypothetical protein